MSGPGSFVDIDRKPGGGRAPQARRTQVLALSGGGYRGLYTARFLELAEQHFGCRARSQFSLISGTSVGALIAAGLALDIPAATMVTKLQEHGPRIFTRSVATPLLQLLVKAPYSAAPLRAAIVDAFGKDLAALPLNQIDTPLTINAVNFTHGRPEIFRSKGLAGSSASAVPLVEAVIASAAAPTYFPTHVIDNATLIDGGLIANAPEMVAVTEACGRMAAPLEEVYVLAIGTAARRQGAALERIGAPSTVSWLTRRALFQSTLAAQEALAEQQCRTLLRDRYLKINREPLENQVAAIRALDLATQQATDTLRSLADESWSEHHSTQGFANFFNACAPGTSA